MLPLNDFIDRLRAGLDELDIIAGDLGDEALDDLDAELEDMLLALSDIRPGAEDWQDELDEVLDDLEAVIDDFDALARRLPDIAAPASRLRMTAGMLRENM